MRRKRNVIHFKIISGKVNKLINYLYKYVLEGNGIQYEIDWA